LYQHVHERVGAVVGGLGGTQEPMLTILQGVGPFPVALHSGGSAGTLNPSAIQQTPPSGTAVEVVGRAVVQAVGRGAAVVQAVGRGAQAFNVQAGGDVKVDQSRKVIDFGTGNQLGNVIATTTAGAAGVDDGQALLRLIEQLRGDVSRLTDVPEGDREDAADELRKAWEAGQRGNRKRLLEKLESAQKLLLPLAGESPTALRVADAVGALLQRALALRG
jgi:hypothetical protein